MTRFNENITHFRKKWFLFLQLFNISDGKNVSRATNRLSNVIGTLVMHYREIKCFAWTLLCSILNYMSGCIEVYWNGCVRVGCATPSLRRLILVSVKIYETGSLCHLNFIVTQMNARLFEISYADKD